MPLGLARRRTGFAVFVRIVVLHTTRLRIVGELVPQATTMVFNRIASRSSTLAATSLSTALALAATLMSAGKGVSCQ